MLESYVWPQSVLLDLANGRYSPCGQHTLRRVSDLKTMFHDQAAAEAAVTGGDPLVYEILNTGFPTPQSDMALSISRIMPGQVGAEYYFTKGHFHAQETQAEIYFCLGGAGYLLLESSAGQFHAEPWRAGTITHIPPGWGHRVVNTGDTVLVFCGIFHLSAGHIYDVVESQGFAQLVVAGDDGPRLTPNPRRGRTQA